MAGIAISTLIMPAYRIAGITTRAGITPSADMYAEAIPALNRLFGSYNLDGHKIYSTSISDPLPLTSGQKIYTIGPGGELDVPRPVFIRGANILFPTDPVVRRPVLILDDDQWRAVRVQDVSGAPPYQLYYDASIDADGRGKVYLRFQPPDGYSLELYTWLALQRDFTASSDVVVLPDGYEEPIVYALAKALAALNPEMAHMSAASYTLAESSLATLIAFNSRAPRIAADPAMCAPDPGPEYGYGWLDGGIQ